MSIDGVHPAGGDGVKLVGTARTLRYLPLRENLFERYGGGMNAQKRAVEGCVRARCSSWTRAGTPPPGRSATSSRCGPSGAARRRHHRRRAPRQRGRRRDEPAGLPRGRAPGRPRPPPRPWDTGLPIACGGALVQPGDVLVGDADGVVVIPPDLVEGLVADAAEQEAQERFITERVAAEPIDGLYPLGPRWRDAYDAWRLQHPTI